jgi:esterase/lipase superfamily enzyme
MADMSRIDAINAEAKRIGDEMLRLGLEQADKNRAIAESGHPDTGALIQENVAEYKLKFDALEKRLRELGKEGEEEGRRLVREGEERMEAYERRMSEMGAQLRSHDELLQRAMGAIKKLQTAPERITILFLAANPHDQQRLAVEREARLIEERIHKSRHPDALDLRTYWAVRPEDVLQALNELNPRIVHFVGHGSDADEIILEDGAGRSLRVGKDAIAATLGAAKDVQLAFFNTCNSRTLARTAAEHVAAAIGMNTAVGDETARDFAAQFYSALGFGRSIEDAFEQAKAGLEMKHVAEADTPELSVMQGLAADAIVLVRPHPEEAAEKAAEDDGSNYEAPLRADPPVMRSAAPAAAAPAPARADASPLPGATVSGTAPPVERNTYTVWFGTNRKPVDPADVRKGFSAERDTRTHFGTCRVFVPRSHKIGSVGSPFWKRWLTGKDDRLRLLKIAEDAEDAFWGKLAARIKRLDVDDRHALVFLHGYNVSFEEAALRAAQIGYDLQVRGPMAFYSWPSKGTLAGYFADGATIDASENEIAYFLERFATLGGATHLHVVAHSMGNRGLLRAMQRIAGRIAANELNVRFGQVILAAPDVDRELFGDLHAALLRVGARTTLYVSQRDRAVELSRWLHDFDRVGFAPPLTVFDGIDTVNVTGVDLTLLGHGYVAEAREVLTDMKQLVEFAAPPDKRAGLMQEQTPEGQPYWEIRA